MNETVNNPFSVSRNELMEKLPMTGDSLVRPFNELVPVAVGKGYIPDFSHEDDMTDAQLKANEELIHLLPTPTLNLSQVYFGAIDEEAEIKRQEEQRKELFMDSQLENILFTSKDPLQSKEVNKILQGIDRYAQSYNLTPDQVKTLKEEVFKSDLLNYVRASINAPPLTELGEDKKKEPTTGGGAAAGDNQDVKKDEDGSDGDDGDGGDSGLEEEQEEVPGAVDGGVPEEGKTEPAAVDGGIPEDVETGGVAGAGGGAGGSNEGDGQHEDRVGDQLGQGGKESSILALDYINTPAYLKSDPSADNIKVFDNGLLLYNKIVDIPATESSVWNTAINLNKLLEEAVMKAQKYNAFTTKRGKQNYVEKQSDSITSSTTPNKIMRKMKDVLKYIDGAKYPFKPKIDFVHAEIIVLEFLSLGYYIVNKNNVRFQVDEPQPVQAPPTQAPTQAPPTQAPADKLDSKGNRIPAGGAAAGQEDKRARRTTRSSNPFA